MGVAPAFAPARASLSAGREYDEMRCCAFNGDGDFNATEHATYYRLLADAGYWTMVAGKDDLTKPSILGHNKRAGVARGASAGATRPDERSTRTRATRARSVFMAGIARCRSGN